MNQFNTGTPEQLPDLPEYQAAPDQDLSSYNVIDISRNDVPPTLRDVVKNLRSQELDANILQKTELFPSAFKRRDLQTGDVVTTVKPKVVQSTFLQVSDSIYRVGSYLADASLSEQIIGIRDQNMGGAYVYHATTLQNSVAILANGTMYRPILSEAYHYGANFSETPLAHYTKGSGLIFVVPVDLEAFDTNPNYMFTPTSDFPQQFYDENIKRFEDLEKLDIAKFELPAGTMLLLR